MKQFLIAIICLIGFPLIGKSQDVLPIAKDGKWGLIDNNGNFALKPIYDYIEFKWRGNKFIYNINGKVGVLNVDGSVYSEPEYEAIEFYSKVMVSSKLNGKWKLEENGELITPSTFDTIYELNQNLMALQNDEEFTIYKRDNKAFSDRTYEAISRYGGFLHGHILNSENHDLMDMETLEIIASDVVKLATFGRRHGIIKFADSMQLYGKKDLELIGPRFQYIEHQFDEYFLCKNDTNCFLLNQNTKSYKPIKNVDDINDIQGNLMVYTKDGLSGIVNLKTGKQVFPAKYTSLALKGSTIFTKNGNLIGIAKTSGKEILPAIYNDIEDYGNLYVVRKARFFGICNLSGKEVERCRYREISVFDKNIKCYHKKTLTTLNISEAGTVEDRTVYDTYMKVSFTKARKPRNSSTDVSFGRSNGNRNRINTAANMKGWYQREMKRVKNDTVTTVYGSWGLKGDDDSLLIKYQYRHLEFPSDKYTFGYRKRPLKNLNSDRALLTARKRQLVYDITKKSASDYKAVAATAYCLGLFQVVNQIGKYKLNPRAKFKALNYFDWDYYALARGCTKTGVLVDSGGYVRFDSLTYIGNYSENKLLVCEGGEAELRKKENESSTKGVRSFYWNMGFTAIDGDREYPYYRIKKGKWFFINKDGERMNEEPFDFAFDFRNNTAIVLRKGKWGVVDTNMTEIVPIAYEYVSRSFVENQQFFTVTTTSKGSYLYNRGNSSYEPTEISSFSNYNDEVLLMRKPGIKHGPYGLIDTNYRQIYDYKIEEVISYCNDYMVIREGQGDEEIHKVINSSGKVIFDDIKGIRIFPLPYGRYKIQKSKSNFYVIDKSGKILIDRFKAYKLIDMNEDCIVYFDSNLEVKVWSKNQIQIPPKKFVLKGFNPKNNYALLQKGKKWQFIYSLNEKKFLLSKLTNVYRLEDEGYLFKDDNEKIGMAHYNGTDTLFQPTYSDFLFEGKDWTFAKLDYKTKVLINRKGENINGKEYAEVIRNEDHYIVKEKNDSSGIMLLDGKMLIPTHCSTVSKKNNWYYDANLKDKSVRYNLDAEIIHTYEAKAGWGLFPKGVAFSDTKFDYFSSYENPYLRFKDIQPISQDQFIVGQEKVYGVYNDIGDTIVPIEFHRISSTVRTFSVRYFNSYGQIDTKGTVLFDAKTAK
ncbi:MAG: hypothetical protein BM555_04835 [Crocinitomix sp. MedPE-SWsnd]|nr:MAG: hypothetical protein BM555_04835 [Crocinitomix sp. MedPE-SWsnd]